MFTRVLLLATIVSPVFAQLSQQQIDEINRQAAETHAKARREQIAEFIAQLEKATEKDLSPNTAIDYMHGSMLLTAEEGIPIYTRFLTHPHPWVRQSCLRALGAHGAKAITAGPIIFEIYQHDLMHYNHEEAARTLGKIGYATDDVFHVFKLRLLFPDPHHRNHHIRRLMPALALYGPKAKVLLPVVEEILDDAKLPLPDRVLTYRAFGSLHAATPPKLAEVTQIDWQTGDRGYALLQEARKPEHAERACVVLLQSLKPDMPNVIRNEIFEVFGGIGHHSPEVVAELLRYLDSPVPTLQTTANQSFLQLEPTNAKVLDLLIQTLKDGVKTETQIAITLLLRKWGPRVKVGTDTVLAGLRQADENEDARLVEMYLHLVRQIGAPAKHGSRQIGMLLARTHLGGVSKFYEPRLRIQMVAALTELGDAAEHLGEIIPLLQPDAKGAYDPVGFMFAARAIASVGPNAKEAVPLLLVALEKKKGWHVPIDLRSGQTGFFVPPPTATSALMQSLAALRSIGPAVADVDRAVPLLQKLASETPPPKELGGHWSNNHVKAAQAALAEITGK